MAAFRGDSIKKAQIPSVCHLCETSKTIQWKCIDCNLLLCDTCKVKVHSKIKLADTHDVISLKDIGKEQSSKRGALNTNCKTHPGHQVCLYCLNCDVVACPNCISESHTKHHLESIGIIHDRTVGKLTYIKDELQADLNEFIDNENKIDEKITTDKQRFEATKTDILRHLEEIKRAIDEEGKKILKRLEKNWIDVETANKADKSTILHVQKEILPKISAAEQALEKNDTVASVNCEKKLSSEWEHRQKLEKRELKLMEFSPGMVDRQIMLNMIGDIHQCKESEMQFDVMKLEKTDMGNITNLYACKDGQVFVCDEYFRHSMKKIVLKNSEFINMQSFKDLRVFDITETNNHEFIMSFIGKKCLMRIKPSGAMEDYVDLSPWIPRALHFTKGGNLLVSGREQGDTFPLADSSDRKIIVMNANGKRLHEFEFDNEKKRLFSLVLRIETLTNNDIVLIDTYGINMEGQVMSIRYPNTINWIYRGESRANPFTPLSIATTSIGNIVVNDRNNHMLHTLNMNGSLIRVIKTDDCGIMMPNSLTLDLKNQLWIGCWDDENEQNAMLYIVKFSGF